MNKEASWALDTSMMQFFEILKSKNEVLYYFGLICLFAALACLVLTKTTQTQVAGVNAWYKPFKFMLSTSILVWSMGWYMQYLNDERAVFFYSWGMVILLGFEDVYISIQAGRGMLSHFNLSSAFYSAMYSGMALASAGISMWTAYIGFLFFSNRVTKIPEPYLWGIRLGIICFVIFSLQGFSMGARLSHTVGAPDGSAGLPVVNWSKKYGDLRIAHFLGMHGLQIIPLLSFYVTRSIIMVFFMAFCYVALTALSFVLALQGKPIFKWNYFLKNIHFICKVFPFSSVLYIHQLTFSANTGMNKTNPLLLSPEDFSRAETGFRLTEKGFSKVAQQKRIALRRYAEGMVGANWADDIVQNVFIKLLSQEFRDTNGGVVLVWMYRVAHNESFDLVRREAKVDMPGVMPEKSVSPDAYRWETRQGIDSILSQLAPIEKDCFNMIHQGYSYKEVGESLSMSEDNVAVVIHRARKKIVAMPR